MNQTPPIARSKSVFVRGFAQPAELKTWLENHVDIRGVTFLGRSNVGKSSIINAIFKNDIARVSNTPGRTQEINLFNFYFEKEDKPYYLFDLPGFGHATVSKQTSQNRG
jgi:GTP-binding protein